MEQSTNKDSIVEQFGTHAGDYVHSKVHARGRSLKRLVELVAPQSGWMVLDIAAGAGHTAFAFAPHVAHVWATDITPQMLEATASGAAERGLSNISVESADAQSLPFEDNHFDLVTCRIAAHHFPNSARFAAEVGRVLKPGGVFGLVDNVVPAGPAGDYVNAFEKLRDPSHVVCLDLEQWRATLQEQGFVVQTVEKQTKEIDFDFWAGRHNERMKGYLKALLSEANEEVTDFLRPRFAQEVTLFHLCEAILVARNSSPS